MHNLIRPARFFALSLMSAALLAACGGGDDDERTPASLTLSKIGGFTHAGGETSAEITAFDPLSKRLFVVNGALGTVDVLDLKDPAARVAARVRRRGATIAPVSGIGSESSSLHWDPAAGQAIPFAAPRHAGGNAPPRP